MESETSLDTGGVQGKGLLLRTRPRAWLFFTILYFAFDNGRQDEFDVWGILWRSVVWGCCGMLTCLPVVALYGRGSAKPLAPRLVYARGALIGPVAGLLWLALFTQLDGVLQIEDNWEPLWEWPRTQVVFEWLEYTLVFLIWIAIDFSENQSHALQLQRIRQAELQRAMAQSQLIAIRSQLRPHFLFNALNSVASLISIDPPKAESSLVTLSELLRSSLVERERWSTLRSEMDIVAKYLQIEKTRFEDQLQVRSCIPQEMIDFWIPSGILLPMFDNAVKHGAYDEQDVRFVDYRVEAKDKELLITVKNLGSLDKAGRKDSLGVGLASIRGRLVAEALSGDDFRVVQQGAWVHAELCLPQRKEPQND